MVEIEGWTAIRACEWFPGMRDEQEKSEVKSPMLSKTEGHQPSALDLAHGPSDCSCVLHRRPYLRARVSRPYLRARVSRPYLRARVNRMGIPATLVYYTGKLGFACLGTWQDPPVYAIVARDHQVIPFRCTDPPTATPDTYRLSSRTQSRCLLIGVREVLCD